MTTKKKSKSSVSKKTSSKALGLEARVKKLEEDMHEMRAKMTDFGDDLAALRTTVKHVDERTLRGERVMLSMQVEQHRMSKNIDLIAEKLQVQPVAPVLQPADPPEEEITDDDIDEDDDIT